MYQSNIELVKKIDKALNKINNMFELADESKIIDDLLELERILEGEKNKWVGKNMQKWYLAIKKLLN